MYQILVRFQKFQYVTLSRKDSLESVGEPVGLGLVLVLGSGLEIKFRP